jgi:predicted DNA-binding transcriptional regulator AlpA
MLARTSVAHDAHVNEREMKKMPPNPEDHHGAGVAFRKKQQPPSTTLATIHQRQRDHFFSDEDARGLPVFIRFRNLKAAGIAENWPHLLALIEGQNFPTGVMLSPNVRAWNIEDVRQWLATRPTDRKVVRRRQVAQAAHQQNSILEGTSK